MVAEDTQALNIIYEARREARGPAQPPRRSRWRLHLVLLAVGLLLVLLAVGGLYLQWSLTHACTVQASVRAAVVDLSPEVDARLKSLLVTAGEKVRVGQELARLDDGQARAQLAAAEADRAIRASLYAQAGLRLQLVRARVAAEIALAQRRVEIAQAGLDAALAELALHRARLPAQVQRAQADRDAARAALELLRQGAREQEIEVARLRLESERALEKLYATELTHTERLYEKKFDSLHNLEAARTKLLTQRNRVREAALELARLEAGARPEEVEQAESTLAGREAALALARTGEKQTALLEATVVSRRAERARAQAELEAARARTLEVTLAEEECRASEAELHKAEAEVDRCRDALASLAIVSPVAGTVIRTFHRPGELCRRGEPLLMVADDGAGRWVEGFVRERDATRIRVGQSARVEVIGSGAEVRATVAAVGLCTASLARPGQASPGAGTPGSMAELVWVKLRPDETMADALPGMSARAVILLR